MINFSNVKVMSITLYQYNMLEEFERAEYLWSKGVHMDERLEDDLTIMLYQVDSFYVEVYYQGNMNVIERLRSFSNVNQLEPYLGS